MSSDVLAATGSSGVRKRILRSALREERERAGLTQKAAAERLIWSETKIIRVEQGYVNVTPADVRTLLKEYGTVEDRIAELVELAKVARQPDEWASYKDAFSSAALDLFANEPAARLVQQYEPSFIPGLFQTRDYTRALLTALGTPAEKLPKRLEGRARRQTILDSPDCPELDVIIGEGALSRPVGGNQVMLDQIERLKQVAKHDRVTVRLLPFRAGPHTGLANAFTILQFKDPTPPDLLYLEDADNEKVIRDEEDVIASYLSRFVELRALASAPDEFAAQLDEIASYRFRN